MRFFYMLFIGLTLFLHACFFWNLRRVWPARWWQWLYLGILVFSVAARFFPAARMWLMRHPSLLAANYFWLGFLIIMTIALFSRDCLEAFSWLADRVAGVEWHQYFGRKSVWVAFAAGAALFGYALFEGWNTRVRTVTVATDRLPAGRDRLRIVFMSDIHITPVTRRSEIDRIVGLANKQNADIVALGGDLVDGQFAPDGPQAEALGALRGDMGRVAVLGNHELYSGREASIRFIEGAGFRLLRGEAVELGGISVVGVDDTQVVGRVEIPEALGRADGDGFVLLISHRPDIPAEAMGKFDLALCGHTHGGQVWPLSIVTRFVHGMPQGMSVLPAGGGGREESRVYISNGTSMWGPPVRLLVPPEITVIDLVRSDN